MKTTIDLSGVGFDAVWGYAMESAAKNPEYKAALYQVASAFFAAKRQNLRFNRKTWVLRDDQSGELSRPSERSEFPTEATLEDATHDLAKSVWCDAVRAHNLANV